MKHPFSTFSLARPGAWMILAAWVSMFGWLRAAAPPADLVVDGVPEIPEGLLQATSVYRATSADTFMGWDPKSGAMLVSSTGKEFRQLNLLLGPLGATGLSTLFPDIINSGSFMPKLGDLIVFAADHNGDEFHQLYRLDPSSGRTTMLTDGCSRNDDVIYDHTGKQIAFLSIMPEAKYPVIYVMDPRNPDSRRIVLDPGVMNPDNAGWALQDWSHDGLHVLASHIPSSRSGYLWSINTFTKETTLLTAQPETQRLYLEARYTPDDAGLYVIVIGAGASRQIEYLPISNGGPVRKVPLAVGNAAGFELSPDGAWLAYLTDEHDSEKLHLFNTLTGEELPQLPLSSGFFSRLRWKEDSTELGFNFGSTTMPFQAFSCKVPGGGLVQWTKSDASGLVSSPIKPQLVKVTGFDGREISGYLYRPDPRRFPGKRPVIISIHGGPSSEFLPGFLGAFNYYPDQMGVALLFPNVRGSTGFGPEFVNLDNGYKREDAVKDIGSFLDWIATDRGLDSSRVAVQGGSYGGYMTLATLYHYGNRVRCGSDLMGFSDFVTLLRHTIKVMQAGARWEFGDERYPDMNKFLESISPLNHAAEIHDPLMITAGKNDPRVPVGESDQMVKAIRANGGIIWYILGEDEGHGFHRMSDAEYQFAAEAYFFQTWLLPEKRLTPLGPGTPVEVKGTPVSAGPD